MLFLLAAAMAHPVFSQQVTYSPYIQLGDNGTFGAADRIVIAWQTDEATPNASAYKVAFRAGERERQVVHPSGRVIANYLAADPSLPSSPSAYGPHTNYTAVLSPLSYDTQYQYVVTGPGMPSGGFTASFHTRKRGAVFSFAVEGDEGYFPVVPNSTPARIVDYEARIAHLVNNASRISLPNQPWRPAPDLILDTGDNVYTVGSEDNYRDFFFPVFNSDQDSNETGAPILRNKLFFHVDGNHDLGSTGVSANLLADNSAPAFSGNLGGGDALSYFNDFYFPQNGPAGFDIQYAWNGDTSVATGFNLTYLGQTYNSPSAIQAFRNSTTVDTGTGAKTQIDHQSNYSFDYGNAHFLYLDANPHLFNDNLPSTNAFNAPPPVFTSYPTALGNWVINDLNSSKQTWKIVVYHQPAFSSGDATIVNNQMRAVAKLLEDHGVNVVFNGHEHNYQRTLPIRSTSRTAGPVSTGSPAVFVDTHFDGSAHTVPDGVLYIVEGGGGNRDFDGNLAPPRGSGVGLDQDDSATGTFTDEPGLTVPQGPASWLDTNLTNREMVNFLPNAGTGTKITTKFKSKVFSFGDVLVNGNQLTLFQISEPLQSTSSATAADPAPYGTDINGQPLNDPIPDTEIDPATGQIVSVSATGKPALLDKWSITKPDLHGSFSATLSAPERVSSGGSLTYTIHISNQSNYSLNGVQVRLNLANNVSVTHAPDGTTVQGNEAVATIGRLAAGQSQDIQLTVTVGGHGEIESSATATSATAQPVATNHVETNVR
jgi:hypothetical protein